MTQPGVFNKISDHYYAGIISILSYRTVLGDYLPSLKLNICSRPVLIDTAVKGGSDFERFIECQVNENGKLEYKTAFLTNPSEDLKRRANFLLCQHEKAIKNSSLSKSQIEKILSAVRT